MIEEADEHVSSGGSEEESSESSSVLSPSSTTQDGGIGTFPLRMALAEGSFFLFLCEQ